MTLTVTLGAKADGTLTAFQVRNVSNTGAYGNHGGETLFAGGAAIAIYRCPNKKFDAYSVYTNTVPSGALRGYGMTQPAFAVESAMHELAHRTRHGPAGTPAPQHRSARAMPCWRWTTTPTMSPSPRTAWRSASIWSTPRCDGHPNDHGLGADWLIGTGTASSVHETAPPTEHISEAWATLGEDGIYEIAVGTVEFGEGTSTAHVQIAANQLGTTPSRIRLVQSDTDRTGFDTGAFASAGLFVAGNAVLRAADALRDRILGFAAAHTRVPVECLLDGRRRRQLRRYPALACRAAAGRPRPRHPIHRGAQGLRVAAQRHVQHPRLPDRRPPRHRRDPHPVQRSGHRRRRRHQPGAGPRPDRRRCRPGHRVRADRELPPSTAPAP